MYRTTPALAAKYDGFVDFCGSIISIRACVRSHQALLQLLLNFNTTVLWENYVTKNIYRFCMFFLPCFLQQWGLQMAAATSICQGMILRQRPYRPNCHLRRLFLKSIYSKDFRYSLVSWVGWRKSEITYFDPPFNPKVPHYAEEKKVRMFILIAQKKCLGTLNARQKTTSPC